MSTNSAILIFDESAIVSGNIHFWKDVSQLGSCLVPEAVMAAVKLLAEDVAADRSNAQPDEAAAAEFLLFFPKSSWKTTSVVQAHEDLAPNPGHDISRKSRLSLVVAQCAYGVASLNHGLPVILVTDTQPLIHRIGRLGLANLIAATATVARQWARTKQPPANISKMIATLQITNPKQPRSLVTTTQPEDISQQWSSSRKPKHNLNRIIGGFVSWAVIAIIVLYGWRSLQPKQFKQFWQKTGLPALPSLPFEQPKSMSK